MDTYFPNNILVDLHECQRKELRPPVIDSDGNYLIEPELKQH